MNGIVAVLLGGLILRLLIAYVIFPGEGFGNDLRLYGAWAQTLADHGPGGFYANAGWTDYPPGYLYVLWFVGVLGNLLSSPLGMPAGDVIDGLLKMPAILADLAVAWLLYRAASRWHGRRAGLAAAALYTFIPVTWYDSALWGPVDSVGALLLVWMALLLIDGWDEQATLVAVLAAVVKPQFAIGLLIVAAVLAGRYLLGRLPEEALQPTGLGGAVDRLFRGWFSQQHGPARLIACTIVGIVAFIVLILPFDLQVWASSDWASTPVLGQAAGFAVLVQNAAGYYNVLTANAFNAWAVAGPTPLSQVLSTGDLQWTWDPGHGSVRRHRPAGHGFRRLAKRQDGHRARPDGAGGGLLRRPNARPRALPVPGLRDRGVPGGCLSRLALVVPHPGPGQHGEPARHPDSPVQGLRHGGHAQSAAG
jgi:hypothetical protein